MISRIEQLWHLWQRQLITWQELSVEDRYTIHQMVLDEANMQIQWEKERHEEDAQLLDLQSTVAVGSCLFRLRESLADRLRRNTRFAMVSAIYKERNL